MTISYNLAPIPKWYFADQTGKPLGAGYLATQSNLDNTVLKPVYQTNSNALPWPYVPIPNQPFLGILFDENGSQGPFYFAFDDAHPDDTYFLIVFDSNGVEQWSIPNFFPPGGGGGAIVTTALDLENLIANNVFWRGTLPTTPVSATKLMRLAPGAHAGFSNNAANPDGTYTGPDIYFIKNNATATDTLSMPILTLGTTFANDVAPVNYLNYTCSVPGSSETQKCVQFPITKSVQNLSNQIVQVSITARCMGGTPSLTLQWYQFFGDGAGASAPVTTPTIATINNLSTSFVKYTFLATVPDVTGKNLGAMGATGNDALFLQVVYPFGVITNIDFTKPCVYLGAIPPEQEYHTYDMIDGIINAPRTGFITSGYDLTAPPGFLLMDDLTIGSATSGATSNGGIGASSNSFPLYCWLWNNVSNPSSNAWCPVSGGIGTSAVSDFLLNKPLQLQRILGRALASAGSGSGLTARTLGQFLGEETHVLTIGELATHSHTPVAPATGFRVKGGGVPTLDETGGVLESIQGATGTTGSNTPHNNMQPTSFVNFYIKL